jgi:hypothetical protein
MSGLEGSAEGDWFCTYLTRHANIHGVGQLRLSCGRSCGTEAVSCPLEECRKKQKRKKEMRMAYKLSLFLAKMVIGTFHVYHNVYFLSVYGKGSGWRSIFCIRFDAPYFQLLCRVASPAINHSCPFILHLCTPLSSLPLPFCPSISYATPFSPTTEFVIIKQESSKQVTESRPCRASRQTKLNQELMLNINIHRVEGSSNNY